MVHLIAGQYRLRLSRVLVIILWFVVVQMAPIFQGTALSVTSFERTICTKDLNEQKMLLQSPPKIHYIEHFVFCVILYASFCPIITHN